MGHHNHPYLVPLSAGSHGICQCGETMEPPLCDDSGGRRCRTLVITVETPCTVAICACGITHTPPLCDGRHGYGKQSNRKSGQT